MITAEQRKQRQKHLGSSDLPVILGVSPYSRTPNDVYWDKVGPLLDDKPTAAMQMGNYLEDVLVQFVRDRLGQDIIITPEQLHFIAKEGPGAGVFAANLDGLLPDRSAAVEAKYVNAYYANDYGEEGTDQVPDHVLVQVQHQMYCANLPATYVAVAVSGFSLELRLYRVKRDEELIRSIVECGMMWWNDHVVAQVPPEDTPPMNVLVNMARTPEKSVALDAATAELIDRYDELKAAGKEAETQMKQLQAKILAALGDAEVGLLEDGRSVSYRQASRRGFDAKSLERDHPDVAGNYVTTSHYRTLRIHKASRRSA